MRPRTTFQIGSDDPNALTIWICQPSHTHEIRSYGDSVRFGFLLGLSNELTDGKPNDIDAALRSRRVRVQTLFTSGMNKSQREWAIEEQSLRALIKSNKPDICIGEVRSDVAGRLVKIFGTERVICLGTDHAATWISKLRNPWYFRLAPTCYQMISAAFRAIAEESVAVDGLYRDRKRFALVVPNYTYGHAFAADCQHLIFNPNDSQRPIGFGLTHTIELGSPRKDGRVMGNEDAYNKAWRDIESCHPDAIILGLWGPELRDFLLEGPRRYLRAIPLVIPDAGWDEPCSSQDIVFARGSILGARYFVQPHVWRTNDNIDLPGIAGNLWDKSWLKSLGGDEYWSPWSVRYPVAASYEAGTILGHFMNTNTGNPKSLTSHVDKIDWRSEAANYLRSAAKIRSYCHNLWANPTTPPEFNFQARSMETIRQSSVTINVDDAIEHRVEHRPVLRICNADVRLDHDDAWEWTPRSHHTMDDHPAPFAG